MNYRNRKLLDVAHEAPCFLKIKGVCESGAFPSVPAHSNRLRHGRGTGYKAHDIWHVAACNKCHYWLDYGKSPREEKDQAFDRALESYWLWLWQENKVSVSKT